MKDTLENVRVEKEKLCNKRLDLAKNNKTKPWSMKELLLALKKNKSQDPSGYAKELFRPEVAGEDLKLAILHLIGIGIL